MRLIDIVTPDILERTLHQPLPSDPAEVKRLTAEFNADRDARLAATKPLADVFARCLATCGDIIDAPKEQQVYVQHLALIVIDAAIEMATKEAV